MKSVYIFCYFFNVNNHQQLIQYYAEYVIIIIHIIISSSHKKHNKTQYTRFLRGNPSPGRKTTKAFITIVFQLQLEGGNNPLVTMTSILHLQLEGGYNPLIYRLQPEGSPSSVDFLAPSFHPNMKIEIVESQLH